MDTNPISVWARRQTLSSLQFGTLLVDGVPEQVEHVAGEHSILVPAIIDLQHGFFLAPLPSQHKRLVDSTPRRLEANIAASGAMLIVLINIDLTPLCLRADRFTFEGEINCARLVVIILRGFHKNRSRFLCYNRYLLSVNKMTI